MQVSRRHFLGTAAMAGAGAGLVITPAHASTERSTGVNVQDMGVLPDSAEDQSVLLQAVIDAASEHSGVVVIPAGTYIVGTLRITRPLRLEGTAGQTVLRLSGNGPLLKINDTEHVTIQGVSFDGNSQPIEGASQEALLAAAGCGSLHIDQCQFTASSASGISLERCGGRISNCTISQTVRAAIFSRDATGLEITGNTVRDSRNNGILVWRSDKGEDGTLVTNNRIERIGAADGGSGQNGNGVNIFRAANVIVAQNRITDCAFSAIRSNAGSACQFIGNSCARLGEVALYAEFDFEGAIIANNVIETAASGVSITNFNDGGRLAVCANNIVRDLFVRPGEVDGRGVGISAEADTVIEGNVVENAPVLGIALGWKHYLRDTTATNNVIRNCATGIGVSVTPGAGKALVANNMISGSTKAAIAGFRKDHMVTADLSDASVTVPDNMAVQGNLVS